MKCTTGSSRIGGEAAVWTAVAAGLCEWREGERAIARRGLSAALAIMWIGSAAIMHSPGGIGVSVRSIVRACDANHVVVEPVDSRHGCGILGLEWRATSEAEVAGLISAVEKELNSRIVGQQVVRAAAINCVNSSVDEGVAAGDTIVTDFECSISAFIVARAFGEGVPWRLAKR